MQVLLKDILNPNERTKVIQVIADINKPIIDLSVDELACLTILLPNQKNVATTPSAYKAPQVLELILNRCVEKGLEVF